MNDLERKVRERYGSAPYAVVAEFAVPNYLEGGDQVGTTIQFVNSGKVTVYLRTRGLWAESDGPELEKYFAKQTSIPVEVSATIAALNLQKHGAAVPPIPSTSLEAGVAEVSAEKHHEYIVDPTPPDITPDIIDDGERNADLSPL